MSELAIHIGTMIGVTYHYHALGCGPATLKNLQDLLAYLERQRDAENAAAQAETREAWTRELWLTDSRGYQTHLSAASHEIYAPKPTGSPLGEPIRSVYSDFVAILNYIDDLKAGFRLAADHATHAEEVERRVSKTGETK